MSLSVKAETIVSGDRLTLGDISEVSAGDEATAARVRLIALGYAPNVGATREIRREAILLALAAAGLNEAAVRLEGASLSVVRRASQRIEPGLIREAVERAALTELRAAGALARLTRLDLPPIIEAPSGALEARATLAGARDMFSPFIVSIELWVDGRVARRLSATAQVEAEAAVLVAAHDIAPRTRVRGSDVRTEVVRLTRPINKYLFDATQLRGVSTNRAISSGEAMTADALASEIVVRTGDAVRIVGASGELRITVAGEARGAGRVGDRVTVKNSQSGMMLQAIVVDEGLVRINF